MVLRPYKLLLQRICVGPKWETLKKKREGLALLSETKMAPGGRDGACLCCLSKLLIGSLDFRAHGQRVITIDSCYNDGT